MRITKLSNKISFSKTLVANCSVIKKDDTPYPCHIFSLDDDSDINYFDNVNNKQDWNNARYLRCLKQDLKTIKDDIADGYRIYSLETMDGDCLGYSEVVKRDNSVDEVLFLETVPTQTFLNSHKSKFKYIGETLLSFMVKKSQQEESRQVELQPSILSTAFYRDKCFFIPPEKEVDPYYLTRNSFSKLIKQNEEHTHSSIELIG